jgi:hypothetical protein
MGEETTGRADSDEVYHLAAPHAPRGLRSRVLADYERFRTGLPPRLTEYVLDRYGMDVRAEYAGQPTRNPVGKASGQLSLNLRQVRRDADAGLGFVVLKTVIAEDPSGTRSMGEWAIPETRMRIDRITSEVGSGWTVTWRGRGWSDTLPAYCDFFRHAVEVGREAGMPVAASAKFHLPPPGEGAFRLEEYQFTTQALQDSWASAGAGRMPFEKDFSPTLAGDPRSSEREQVLVWLARVPDLIRQAARPHGVALGIKVMNARFEPEFQVEMVRAVTDGPREPPDFLVYANRLFDPEREFGGTRGVAYGGPQLGARNLCCLDLIRRAAMSGLIRRPLPPLSATGDILTGRRAVEYGLLGARSCQLHTLFQLPDTEFGATTRNKTEAVLHHLLFHPDSGLLVWLERIRLQSGRSQLSWLQLPEVGLELLNRHASGAAERANAGNKKRRGSA